MLVGDKMDEVFGKREQHMISDHDQSIPQEFGNVCDLPTDASAPRLQ